MTKFSFTHLVIEMTVNNGRRKQQFPTLHDNFTSKDPAITDRLSRPQPLDREGPVM